MLSAGILAAAKPAEIRTAKYRKFGFVFSYDHETVLSQALTDRTAALRNLLVVGRSSGILPIVSIVVPFFGYPVLWLGSYNRDFG